MKKFEKEKILPIVLLIFIVAIAAFFRLWKLNEIPPGLFQDVALNGNDALTALEKKEFKLFYPDNAGREGLFINLIALSFSIFGASIWSIKIVAAIIGILTLIGTYLLTQELFQNTKYIPLLSSFFLAISFWHTNFSRIGFRGILLPFILVFSFYFLFKGFREKKVLNFIISGIFFGLGFYTYTAYRFIVLLLPIVLFCWFLIYREKKEEKQFLSFIKYCLTPAVIVALPLAIYFLKNPGNFFERAAEVSVFNQKNPARAFLISLVKHLGMFNFSGDPNWQHNYVNSPQLFWPIGILFLVGFYLSIKEMVSAIKNKNHFQVLIPCFLLSWFFIMLLPGALTYEGIPNSLRVIGLIPVAYIFAARGGWSLYEHLAQKNRRYQNLLVVISIILLLMTGFAEFKKYFFSWGHLPEVETAFLKYQVEIGNYLNSLPPDVQKYVILNYVLVDREGNLVNFSSDLPALAHVPVFIERSWRYNQGGNAKNEPTTYLAPSALDKIKIGGELSIYKSGKVVIIPLFYYPDFLEKISNKFPGGKIENHNGVWAYKIK